jgi:membrane protease YdiL (CAAX protease family)
MIPYKKHKLIVGLLFVYMTGMFVYLFPRNNEMSEVEKWAVVGVSYLLLIILWFVLKKRDSLRSKRDDEFNNLK